MEKDAGTSQFLGDYIGITVEPGTSVAHPVWSNNTLQTTAADDPIIAKRAAMSTARC